MSKYTIEVSNLVKRYGNFEAVKGISFNVNKGEIFGFLGPNGAGKTTTVHILTTIIDKTSGDAYVCGYDVSKQKEKVRENIGIVFQDPSLDDRLTGYENLDFHAMIYGINKEYRRKRIKEALEMVELEDKADTLVMYYSGGMKRRLEIARGLLNQPEVLFLDEPTVGLDVQTRRHILDYIKALRDRYKMTIFLTTHYIEEADYLCDRIAIIDHGKIIALDTPENLKKSIGGDTLSLTLKHKSDIKIILNALSRLDVIEDVKVENNSIYLILKDASSNIVDIMNIAYNKNVAIEKVEIRRPSLEDVFIHYTGRSIREEEGSNLDRIRMRLRAGMR
ncbi:MAG: ABC transporter ATP-binding protein [Candidatus Micrarchaeota archaeon]|nr:MAG: ABC transporter ATP-binding protein [Candidatus Micrarchaeota archaeon]